MFHEVDDEVVMRLPLEYEVLTAPVVSSPEVDDEIVMRLPVDESVLTAPAVEQPKGQVLEIDDEVSFFSPASDNEEILPAEIVVNLNDTQKAEAQFHLEYAREELRCILKAHSEKKYNEREIGTELLLVEEKRSYLETLRDGMKAELDAEIEEKDIKNQVMKQIRRRHNGIEPGFSSNLRQESYTIDDVEEAGYEYVPPNVQPVTTSFDSTVVPDNAKYGLPFRRLFLATCSKRYVEMKDAEAEAMWRQRMIKKRAAQAKLEKAREELRQLLASTEELSERKVGPELVSDNEYLEQLRAELIAEVEQSLEEKKAKCVRRGAFARSDGAQKAAWIRSNGITVRSNLRRYTFRLEHVEASGYEYVAPNVNFIVLPMDQRVPEIIKFGFMQFRQIMKEEVDYDFLLSKDEELMSKWQN